jgi:hypothetical protein
MSILDLISSAMGRPDPTMELMRVTIAGRRAASSRGSGRPWRRQCPREHGRISAAAGLPVAARHGADEPAAGAARDVGQAMMDMQNLAYANEQANRGLALR